MLHQEKELPNDLGGDTFNDKKLATKRPGFLFSFLFWVCLFVFVCLFVHIPVFKGRVFTNNYQLCIFVNEY